MAARLAGLLVRLAAQRPGLEPDYRVAAELGSAVGPGFSGQTLGRYE
jgi:hypothetical protein